MMPKASAQKAENGIEETLTYCDIPSEFWNRIRTNNVIERLNRENHRRTRVVGSFSDGNSALMPVCAGRTMLPAPIGATKKYIKMNPLEHLKGSANNPVERASNEGIKWRRPYSKYSTGHQGNEVRTGRASLNRINLVEKNGAAGCPAVSCGGSSGTASVTCFAAQRAENTLS